MKLGPLLILIIVILLLAVVVLLIIFVVSLVIKIRKKKKITMFHILGTIILFIVFLWTFGGLFLDVIINLPYYDNTSKNPNDLSRCYAPIYQKNPSMQRGCIKRHAREAINVSLCNMLEDESVRLGCVSQYKFQNLFQNVTEGIEACENLFEDKEIRVYCNRHGINNTCLNYSTSNYLIHCLDMFSETQS